MDYVLYLRGKVEVNSQHNEYWLTRPYTIHVPLVKAGGKGYAELWEKSYEWSISEDGDFKCSMFFWHEIDVSPFVNVLFFERNDYSWIEFNPDHNNSEELTVSIDELMCEVEKTYKSKTLKSFLKWLDYRKGYEKWLDNL